ncbi:hypothetical protein WMY93_023489 [Mugilogobius chulae]|uniref:TBC1 domain family member 2B n=1 Tax=Mugilogobius chulae TaxID=88201 RepID=A0AAW0N7G5_9GOBI
MSSRFNFYHNIAQPYVTIISTRRFYAVHYISHNAPRDSSGSHVDGRWKQAWTSARVHIHATTTGSSATTQPRAKMHEEEDGSEASPGTSSSPPPAPRMVSSKSLEVPESEAGKEQAPKLCGYLSKLSGKGPLRGYKPRWFVYDPRKCYMYYFKTPQDALPLGHIDISDASFSYDLDGEEGQFQIRTAGKEFLLKAPSRQVMHYWLQQLQQKRWEYSSRSGHRDSWSSPVTAHPPTGLVANDNDGVVFVKLNESMEKVRSDFALETEANGAVSADSPLSRGPPGRLQTLSTHSETSAPSSDSFGSAFSFKRPLLPGRLGRASADMTSVECNGSRPVDLLVRLQNQQEELSRMQEEEAQLREELLTHKELVRLLQQTLRTSQCDWQTSRRVTQTSAPSDPNLPSPEQTDPLDAQIQSLCGHMERLALEKDSLQKELKGLKLKVGEMNEQLGMLMETIQAKDEVIMKLSQQPSSEAGQSEPGSPGPNKDQFEVDILKDSLQGYKTQNKFLNKEILELTMLRRNSESREKTLEAKYTALEAKLCQVESKYLVLLQEVKTPVCGSSEQSPAREVISRLLEDALQGEGPEHEHMLLKPNTVSEYDVFGFKTVPEEEEEEEKLVAKVRALELKSLSMTDQEVSVGVKWENYLASTMNRNLVRSPELKSLVRCGVPHEHRSQLWRWCVSFHVKKLRENMAPDYYETLLNVAKEKPNPASKQIELDLLRTLPNNKHYSSPSATGIQKLRNVLTAFSWRNPDIGYCQGLNRLAAIALLYLDQEDAFWTLIAIVEVFMPRDYYTKTCWAHRWTSKLMNMAFVDMNPFPMRQIQSRRSFHLEKVRLELNELEAIRQTFLRERESSQDGRSFVSDDDEDN